MPKKLVVFISPPTSALLEASQSNPLLKLEDASPSDIPALGILTLASAVKQQVENVQPIYLDGSVCPFSVMLDFISSHKNDIIAICLSALRSTYIAGLKILEHARKENPRIVHIIGNDHFTALSTLCMQNQPDLIDCGIMGNEVIGGLCQIISQIEREGGWNPVAVPGLVFRDSDKVIHIPQKPEPIFSTIDYSLINQTFDHSARYAQAYQKDFQDSVQKWFGSSAHSLTSVELARGCIKFKNNDTCSFCAIQYGGMWKNEVRNGAEAWSILHRAYQAGYDSLDITAEELPLTFPQLLLDMKSSIPRWFANLPQQERPILHGAARADGLAIEKNARLLYDLGFRFIFVGVEAGPIKSLAALNKPLAGDSAVRLSRLYEASRQALKHAHNIGFKVEIGYVLGHIGMTRELLLENIELFRSLVMEHHDSIAYVAMGLLIPEPGSKDYAYLIDPDLAEKRAATLGLTIAPRKIRQEIADELKTKDEMWLDAQVTDYVRAFMPELTVSDLIEARKQLEGICRANRVMGSYYLGED